MKAVLEPDDLPLHVKLPKLKLALPVVSANEQGTPVACIGSRNELRKVADHFRRCVRAIDAVIQKSPGTVDP